MTRLVASSLYAICKTSFATKRRSPELNGGIESRPMKSMYIKDDNSGRKRARSLVQVTGTVQAKAQAAEMTAHSSGYMTMK